MCRNSGLQYGASACTSGIWCYSNDSYRRVGKYLVYIQSAGSWCSGICSVLSFCRSHKTCCCYIFYLILLLLFFDCCSSAPDMLCPFPLLYIVSEFWAMFFRFHFLFSNLGQERTWSGTEIIVWSMFILHTWKLNLLVVIYVHPHCDNSSDGK